MEFAVRGDCSHMQLTLTFHTYSPGSTISNRIYLMKSKHFNSLPLQLAVYQQRLYDMSSDQP